MSATPHPHHDGHHRAHFLELAQALAGRTGVLDVGCGDGALARHLALAGHCVTGIDADPRVLPDAGAGPMFVHGDATRLPFPDTSFDAVTMVGVLHHVDAHRALAEARRVLVPGGLVAVIDGAHGGTHGAPGSPVRYDDGAATRALVEGGLPGAVVRDLPQGRFLATWTAPR